MPERTELVSALELWYHLTTHWSC